MSAFSSMPFVDLTLREKEKFLKQTRGCHIPGYTGYCPTLKFRFGKPYGATTKEINEKLKNLSTHPNDKGEKENDFWLSASEEVVEKKSNYKFPNTNRLVPKRSFILGYTGFIPGLNFEYGLPFYVAANKSITNFELKRVEEENTREMERMQFINTKPKMCCARNTDEVASLFDDNIHSFYNTTVLPVAPELPPIAGYTGHIPGVKGNEASLSRYYSAAKAGLTSLREKRKRDRNIILAKEAVANALESIP